MLTLTIDLQRLILVKGLLSATEYRLPLLYEGMVIPFRVVGVLPTGVPSAPYAVQQITNFLLAYNNANAPETSAIVAQSIVIAQDGLSATGTLTIPVDGVVPTGQRFALGALAIDITAGGGPMHLEPPCVCNIPIAGLTPPYTYANFQGPPGADGAPGTGAVASVNGQTGTVVLPKSVTTPPITVQPGVDDYTQAGLAQATVLRFNNALPSSYVDITGIQGGFDGRVLTVINVSAASDSGIFLRNEAVSSGPHSQPANGLHTFSGSDVLLPQGAAIDLVYDGTISRWRVRDLNAKNVDISQGLALNANNLFSGNDGVPVIEGDDGDGNVHFYDRPVIFDNPAVYRTALGVSTSSFNPASPGPIGGTTPGAIRLSSAALAYASSIALDFQGAAYQSLALTGDATFSSANRAAGWAIAIIITADSTARNLTFPGWTFIGAAAPASIAAGKTAVLSLTCAGTTDASVIAAYAAQP